MSAFSYYLSRPRRLMRALREHHERQVAANREKSLAWLPDAESLMPAERKARRVHSVTHVGMFSRGNAGDHLLPVALRDLFDHGDETLDWRLRHAWPVMTEDDARRVNETRGLVIGGGGLFLRDTNANQNSGWQWNCPVPVLERIQTPIVVFAVGYNRFRGQPDFDPVFREHLALLAEKSVYIGLRNQGSIRAISEYLPERFRGKLRFQPCMTTLAAHLYPALAHPERHKEGAGRRSVIAVNIAFDRPELRYQGRERELLTTVAEALKELSREHQIHLLIQVGSDDAFRPYLETAGVAYERVDIRDWPLAKILEYYASIALTIGMRGHAQMIPFGCGSPILSLISHDKVRWFLDDIGRTDAWGIEILEPDLKARLLARARVLVARRAETSADVLRIQGELWKISLENVALAKKAMGISIA